MKHTVLNSIFSSLIPPSDFSDSNPDASRTCEAAIKYIPQPANLFVVDTSFWRSSSKINTLCLILAGIGCIESYSSKRSSRHWSYIRKGYCFDLYKLYHAVWDLSARLWVPALLSTCSWSRELILIYGAQFTAIKALKLHYVHNMPKLAVIWKIRRLNVRSRWKQKIGQSIYYSSSPTYRVPDRKLPVNIPCSLDL